MQVGGGRAPGLFFTFLYGGGLSILKKQLSASKGCSILSEKALSLHLEDMKFSCCGWRVDFMGWGCFEDLPILFHVVIRPVYSFQIILHGKLHYSSPQHEPTQNVNLHMNIRLL